MIVHRISGIFRFQILIQCGLLSLLYWGWYFLYAKVLTEGLAFPAYLNYWIVALVAIILEAFSRNSQERSPTRRKGSRLRTGAIRQTLYLTGAISIFLVMAKDEAMSRSFLFIFIGAGFIVLNYSQMILANILPEIVYRHRNRTRTLLIGSAAGVHSFQEWIGEKKVFGIEIVGVLSHDSGEEFDEDIQPHYMGDPAQLEEVLLSNRADQVILLESSEDMMAIREMIRLCEQQGIRFAMLNDLSAKMGKQIGHGGNDAINLMFLYEEPLEDPFNQMLKRMFDLVVASFAVVVILPLACLFVKLMHLVQSRGPLLYKQLRTGINGQPFEIYKFRAPDLEWW